MLSSSLWPCEIRYCLDSVINFIFWPFWSKYPQPFWTSLKSHTSQIPAMASSEFPGRQELESSIQYFTPVSVLVSFLVLLLNYFPNKFLEPEPILQGLLLGGATRSSSVSGDGQKLSGEAPQGQRTQGPPDSLRWLL